VPHVTIEYIILLPILILQIFLFPLTASWLMNIWVDSRRTLALKDVGSHLGSTIQQMYFSLDHETISDGTLTYSPGLPPFIEDTPYVGNATMRSVLGPEPNSSKVLELTIRLIGTTSSVTSMVILGPNVVWQESFFSSNSSNACVNARKSNGNITLWFGT